MTIFLNSCSGQQSKPKEERIYYDTLKLLEPKISKEDVASPQDYKHCIDLTQSDYLIVINGAKYFKANKGELSAFIKNKRKDIIKQKISVISDSLTSYRKIVNILDIITEQKINNYKLVSVYGKLPQTPPIVVQSTKPFTKDIQLTDSTVLIISILDSTFETSLLNKIAIHREVSELDKFIVNNKKNIDPYKIVVMGAENLPYKVVKPVISLLTKYDYNNFHIIPKN